MGKIYETKVPPKERSHNFTINVFGEDMGRWESELYPWIKDNTIGNVYVDKILVEPYCKPVYHTYRLWFSKKKDAAFFKLMWMLNT
jgi:hypothetical protein